MSVSAVAGHLPDPSTLIDLDRLVGAYYDDEPDPSVPEQRVTFGTSGHRGSSLARTFNEAHVLAISEAVCRYRQSQGIDGPLFLGRDTHQLSEQAFRTIVEVLSARGVEVTIDADDTATTGWSLFPGLLPEKGSEETETRSSSGLREYRHGDSKPTRPRSRKSLVEPNHAARATLRAIARSGRFRSNPVEPACDWRATGAHSASPGF